MSFAVGGAIIVGGAMMYGASQAASSQRDANSKNYKIAKAQLAQNARHFKMQYEQEEKRIEETMRQFDLSREDATTRFHLEKRMAEAELKLSQDKFEEARSQFEQSFGLQESQLQETMRQYNLNREDAAEQLAEEVRQYEQQFGLEEERFGETKRQFEEQLGFERERSAEDIRQFEEQLGFAREKEAEGMRQFEEQFGFEKEKYADIGERETERRKREELINQQMYERFAELQEQQRESVSPYTIAGDQAIEKRNALMGVYGPEAQQKAYDEIRESPGQQFLRERQERALLRNQAALGGLGGGNVRTALQEQAYERSTQAIDEEMARLNELARQGLAARDIKAPTQPGYIATGSDVGVI